MKRLHTLPEHYLRHLLEANAEEARLEPCRSSGPCWPRAFWQHSGPVLGAQQRLDEGPKANQHHRRLVVGDFDLSGFLPELAMSERFQLLMELVAASDDLRLDLLGLKQLANVRLRVSLRGMECRGAHPHDEYATLLAVFVHAEFLTFMRDAPLERVFTDQICNESFGLRSVLVGAPERLHGRVVFIGIPLEQPMAFGREFQLWNGGCR